MPRLTLISPFVTAAALCIGSGCTPTFNWREVRPDDTRLSLLLPCKPDKAQKPVSLGGQSTTLSMLGCDAGGVTFAVAVVDLSKGMTASSVLSQWKSVTLTNMKAGAEQVEAVKLPGAALEPSPVLVKAQGRRADGAAVTGQMLYFVQGTQVFQAVMYASQITPDTADTFFSSLKFD